MDTRLHGRADQAFALAVWQPEIDELHRRRALAAEMGGTERVARQKAAGKLTIRWTIAVDGSVQTPTGTSYEIPTGLELERVRIWETSTSWGEYADQVRRAGKSLIALGFEPGQHVAILGFNGPEWVIAFWHHPPYSKGSHDSDVELGLVEMRQNALPMLEDASATLTAVEQGKGVALARWSLVAADLPVAG